MKTILTIFLVFSHFSFSDSQDSEDSQEESSSVTDNELIIALERADLYLKQQNYEKALIWLEKSARQGHALAQYIVGLMYYKGLGVPQDDKQALIWLERVVVAQQRSDSIDRQIKQK